METAGSQEESDDCSTSHLRVTPHEISGGEWNSAVFGNQINKNKTVLVYPDQTAQTLEEGQFKLAPGITVFENIPICPESRIFRGKLLSGVLGDREIAIKLLQHTERHIREAKIHFSVPHHENIVERILTDTFSYRGQLTIYIAMECCDKQNLHEYITSQARSGARFDDSKYLSFAFQIANGMHFLHRHKVMNRDVKPENILLANNKTKVKIADFGLSKQLPEDRHVATQSLCRPGTDGWCAPEVLKHESHVSVKCDVFPMGLIFNFLWSYGKHPFGDDPDSWNHYIKRGENCNLDQLLIPNPEVAKDLLTQMLQMDPAKRPTVAAILMHPILKNLCPSADPDICNAIDETLAGEDDIINHGEDEQDKDIILTKTQLAKIVKKVIKKTEVPQPAMGERSRRIEPPAPVISWELPYDEIQDSKKIADGGYSEIWLGHFKKAVAVKKCNMNIFSDERLKNEAEALKHLRHENIIRLIGVVTQKPFKVVFELAEHGSLAHYLKAGEGKTSTFGEKVTMATQVASGMAHIEKMKYIHRLLRLRFIMVGKGMICKISTFGRAIYLGDDDECRRSPDDCDSVAWMAPETMEQHRYSIKTDVWSFGILISEILTNDQPPYPEWKDEDIKRHIKDGDRMPKQPNWPAKMYDDVMLKCWRHEPQTRPSFAQLEKILKEDFAQ